LRIALGLVLFGCAPRAGAIDPLVTNYGLGHILHPLQEPAGVPVPCGPDGQPCPCDKDHVYIFGVNGLNPLCTGNFNGLCGYLRKQGFTHTYFGQLYTSHWYSNKIREIRAADPQARIALVGFSLGANYVKAIANNLNQDGTRIDLLVYLVGDLISNKESSHPPNVVRVVNVRAQGLVLTGGDLFFNGADIDGAENRKLKCRHILVPSRRETLELMMDEMMRLACQVPPRPAGR